MKERIVIVTGMARCGNTLMGRILNGHSQIAMPPKEFAFVNGWRHGSTIEELLGRPKERGWGIEASDLIGLDAGDAWVATIRRYRDMRGAPIAGMTEPWLYLHLPLVKEWLAEWNVRFIQMIRNPIDCWASLSKMREKKGEPLIAKEFIINWIQAVSVAAMRVWSSPQRYAMVRYEDLCVAPDLVMRGVCGFLGVDYEEQVLDADILQPVFSRMTSFPEARQKEHGRHSGLWQPVSHRGHVQDNDYNLIASTCDILAGELGYKLNGRL